MAEWAEWYYQNYAFGLSRSAWRGHMEVACNLGEWVERPVRGFFQYWDMEDRFAGYWTFLDGPKGESAGKAEIAKIIEESLNTVPMGPRARIFWRISRLDWTWRAVVVADGCHRMVVSGPLFTLNEAVKWWARALWRASWNEKTNLTLSLREKRMQWNEDEKSDPWPEPVWIGPGMEFRADETPDKILRRAGELKPLKGATIRYRYYGDRGLRYEGPSTCGNTRVLPYEKVQEFGYEGDWAALEDAVAVAPEGGGAWLEIWASDRRSYSCGASRDLGYALRNLLGWREKDIEARLGDWFDGRRRPFEGRDICGPDGRELVAYRDLGLAPVYDREKHRLRVVRGVGSPNGSDGGPVTVAEIPLTDKVTDKEYYSKLRVLSQIALVTYHQNLYHTERPSGVGDVRDILAELGDPQTSHVSPLWKDKRVTPVEFPGGLTVRICECLEREKARDMLTAAAEFARN